MKPIKVLDHGYVKLIESWGVGEAGEMEAAIIEAARQSTQGSFRGWDVWICNECGSEFNEKVTRHYNYTVPGVGMLCDGKLSNDEALLKFMFNNSHSTPFEFAGMVLEVQAPIFVFREWHRHRVFGFNEMSARYAALPDINYTPTKERLFLTQEKNKQAQSIDGRELLDSNAANWLQALDEFYTDAEKMYRYGLDIGIPKELARIVLPVGRYSRMRATANLRNWLGFLTLRMHPDAQYEIRMFANAVGEIISKEFPRTWKLFNKEK